MSKMILSISSKSLWLQGGYWKLTRVGRRQVALEPQHELAACHRLNLIAAVIHVEHHTASRAAG